MSKKFTAFIMILGFAICLTVALKLTPGLLVSMDAYQLAFWTCLLIFIPVNLILAAIKTITRSKNTGSIMISLLASVFLFGGLWLYLMGAGALGHNSAFAIIFMGPLVILMFIPLLSKESLSAPKILAVVIAAVGAYCIFVGGGLVHPETFKNLIYIIAAAISWIIFCMLSIKTKTTVLANIYIYILMGTIFATAALFLQSTFVVPSLGSFWSILLFGAIVFLVIFLWSGILKYSSVSFWGAMIYMLPAVMLLYEIVFQSAGVVLSETIGLAITGLAVLYRMSIKYDSIS